MSPESANWTAILRRLTGCAPGLRPPLDDREQRLRPVVRAALARALVEQAADQLEAAEVNADLAGGLLDEAQVLLLELDHEAGGEVAGQHAGAEVGELP